MMQLTVAQQAELASSTRAHDSAGLVSLTVLEAKERYCEPGPFILSPQGLYVAPIYRPITEKLIAKNGKLVTIQVDLRPHVKVFDHMPRFIDIEGYSNDTAGPSLGFAVLCKAGFTLYRSSKLERPPMALASS